MQKTLSQKQQTAQEMQNEYLRQNEIYQTIVDAQERLQQANDKEQNSAETSAPRITQKTPKTGDTSDFGGALAMLVAGLSTVGLSLRKK